MLAAGGDTVVEDDVAGVTPVSGERSGVDSSDQVRYDLRSSLEEELPDRIVKTPKPYE